MADNSLNPCVTLHLDGSSIEENKYVPGTFMGKLTLRGVVTDYTRWPEVVKSLDGKEYYAQGDLEQQVHELLKHELQQVEQKLADSERLRKEEAARHAAELSRANARVESAEFELRAARAEVDRIHALMAQPASA